MTKLFPMFLKTILALLIGYGILENVPSRPPASVTSSCWGSSGQKPQQLLTETDIPLKTDMDLILYASIQTFCPLLHLGSGLF